MLTETRLCVEDEIRNNQPAHAALKLDHCSKGFIRFYVESWDAVEGVLSGSGEWVNTKRAILFEVVNNLDGIASKLLVGPGDSAFREKVFLATAEYPKVFKKRSKNMGAKHTQIFNVRLVNKEQMDYDLDSIKSLLQQNIQKFLLHGEFGEIYETMNKILGVNN